MTSFNILLAVFLLTLTFNLSLTSASSNSTSVSKDTRTNIRCTSFGDCPTNSVCYQSKCVCRYGYIWLEPIQFCSPLLCPADLVCKILPNSRCHDGSCVCIDGYKVDEESQLCEKDKLTTGALIGIGIAALVVLIFLVIIVLVVINCCCRK